MRAFVLRFRCRVKHRISWHCLLHPMPGQRPTASEALCHPFFRAPHAETSVTYPIRHIVPVHPIPPAVHRVTYLARMYEVARQCGCDSACFFLACAYADFLLSTLAPNLADTETAVNNRTCLACVALARYATEGRVPRLAHLIAATGMQVALSKAMLLADMDVICGMLGYHLLRETEMSFAFAILPEEKRYSAPSMSLAEALGDELSSPHASRVPYPIRANRALWNSRDADARRTYAHHMQWREIEWETTGPEEGWTPTTQAFLARHHRWPWHSPPRKRVSTVVPPPTAASPTSPERKITIWPPAVARVSLSSSTVLTGRGIETEEALERLGRDLHLTVWFFLCFSFVVRLGFTIVQWTSHILDSWNPIILSFFSILISLILVVVRGIVYLRRLGQFISRQQRIQTYHRILIKVWCVRLVFILLSGVVGFYILVGTGVSAILDVWCNVQRGSRTVLWPLYCIVGWLPVSFSVWFLRYVG